MEKVGEKDVLINRSQMLQIAREYKIFVTKSTIHRWANEPGFPTVIGKNGRFLLYSDQSFISFLLKRIQNMKEDH